MYGGNREGVILPYSPRERGEVEVYLSLSFCAWDIDLEVVVVNDGDVGTFDARSKQSQRASEKAVKPPDAEGKHDPILIAPLPLEAFVDVQHTADHGKHRENDVR